MYGLSVSVAHTTNGHGIGCQVYVIISIIIIVTAYRLGVMLFDMPFLTIS